MTAARAEYVRDYQAARMRALARLKDRHRGEYAALLTEERAKTDTPQAGNE